MLKRTSSEDKDFRSLVKELDEDLANLYGEKQAFYSQFNALQLIQHVLVAYVQAVPIGCGAIKKYDDDAMEIKRMYVKPEYRNKGIAYSILSELEQWAREMNYKTCILETGNKQPDAVHLYKKSGYTFIPNYGQYQEDEGSICMKKDLMDKG